MTILDDLLEEDEILAAMLDMDKRANEQLVKSRRTHLFGFLWKHDVVDREVIMKEVKETEHVLVSEYSECGVPDWLLKLEAQDMFLEYLHNEFKEERLL